MHPLGILMDALVRSIEARAALSAHKCKKHPAWCPGQDRGCGEALALSKIDDEYFEAAINGMEIYKSKTGQLYQQEQQREASKDLEEHF